MTTPEVTVGVDIGTSSVKAIAADGDGNVVASARVPHRFGVPSPGRFQHDAEVAWRRGPREALAAVATDVDVRAVSVAAMVPSLTAVDADGVPVVPGLLYGDERGREGGGRESGESPAESGELLGFVRWAAREAPEAAGYWPAQAVANHALCGHGVLDTSTAATAYPLFDFTSWDPKIAASVGARAEQFPRLVPTGWEAGRVATGTTGDGTPLASGCIDALAEQLVAGADDDGDVLLILGTTLIVWAVTTSEEQVPGYWTIPHTAAGKLLVGGPSNAGGLFCNWAAGLLGEPTGPAEPGRVPVWAPYPRGERTPLHDPDRRAVLADLDLTHDAAAVRRAAFEASGFVVRRALDAARAHAGVDPRRLVVTGGGARVHDWVQAVTDATQVPVACVAVPEGGALGSAWLARIAAGLEEPTAMTAGRRWARVGRRVEPDPAWVEPTAERYERFLELS
jgi:sugar (pentulose or hexulose) kinase